MRNQPQHRLVTGTLLALAFAALPAGAAPLIEFKVGELSLAKQQPLVFHSTSPLPPELAALLKDPAKDAFLHLDEVEYHEPAVKKPADAQWGRLLVFLVKREEKDGGVSSVHFVGHLSGAPLHHAHKQNFVFGIPPALRIELAKEEKKDVSIVFYPEAAVAGAKMVVGKARLNGTAE
jgi:hypothetical protein